MVFRSFFAGGSESRVSEENAGDSNEDVSNGENSNENASNGENSNENASNEENSNENRWPPWREFHLKTPRTRAL